jgi:plastocyanin domain-containing protein
MTSRLLVLIALGAAAAFACNKEEPVTKDGVHFAIRADNKGFTPASVTVKKGSPAVLVFTRTSDATCAKAVAFPDLNMKKDLPLNTPVEVTVPTDTSRTIGFTCGMGMFASSVVVQ